MMPERGASAEQAGIPRDPCGAISHVCRRIRSWFSRGQAAIAAPETDPADSSGPSDPHLPLFIKKTKGLLPGEAEGIDARRAMLAERFRKAYRLPSGTDVEPPENAEGLGLAKQATGADDAPLPPLYGLALSGGGIRSAAYCLGALQAMDAVVQTPPATDAPDEADSDEAHRPPSVFDRFDFLSTVSGGGYIGAACAAAQSMNGGFFPFRSRLDQEEPPAVQHVRDHSNYLFPTAWAVLESVAIYLRGLALNVFMTIPYLVGAGLWVVLWRRVQAWMPVPASVLAFAVLAVLLVAWALRRSMRAAQAQPEDWGSCFARAVMSGMLLLALFLWSDASAALVGLIERAPSPGGRIAALAGMLAPLSALVAFVGPRLTALIQKIEDKPTWSALISRAVGIAVLWLGAAVVPVLLWAAALWLAVLGMPAADIYSPAGMAMPGCLCVPLSALVPVRWCGFAVLSAVFSVFLLVWLVRQLFPSLQEAYPFGLSSLHRLYRDRLSAAFLVDPPGPGDPAGTTLQLADRFQLVDTIVPQCARTKPTGLTETDAPYLLVNAAVNLQSSSFGNKRGRNADFFLFSRNYVGSNATGYVRTARLLKSQPGLDLGTAVAVSGAAVSSNMGASSIAPLTPTLTLLNVRLGYWLKNPRSFGPDPSKVAGGALFLREMFGRLHEYLPQVYVSDGGHIDNLGLYELLRRRCRLIVVIDAEADPDYTFSSFITLQRYARIDLGVRIDIPREAIRTGAKSVDAAGPAGCGPHAAVGRIYYGPDGEPREGILVYVKSSVSGDESDIIRSYKARYPSFPHENTLDQLFSEEQFEVYRALGFHAVRRFLVGLDNVAVMPPPAACVPLVPAGVTLKGLGSSHSLLDEVRRLLRLPRIVG